MIVVSLLALATAVQAPRADTLPPVGVVEQAFVTRNGAIELAGTLTLPAPSGRVPVAVIIAGSGPTDRNGNSRLALRSNMYAQLAWRLAERGIATLRYDKRSLGGSSTAFDLSRSTIDDFAADARAAADTLARDARFSRVVLLGHSEGALLAVLAARDGAPVAGVVSVAGMGRAMGALLREQLSRQLDSATLARFDVAMASYLRGDTPADVPPALAPFFAPVNRAFLQSVMALDPTIPMGLVRQPVLIVQGAHDAQVTIGDAERLHVAHPGARLTVIAKANHLLKETADATLAGQGATYRDPTLPIMPAAVTAIAEWILGLGSGRD